MRSHDHTKQLLPKLRCLRTNCEHFLPGKVKLYDDLRWDLLVHFQELHVDLYFEPDPDNVEQVRVGSVLANDIRD